MHTELTAAIEKDYGIKVAHSRQPESYFKRVWEIEDNSGKRFVVKFLENRDAYQLRHHEAEIAFAETINTRMQSLQSVTFLPDASGAVLHKIHPEKEDYYVVMEYHPIVIKPDLTPGEQQHLGKVMAEMHAALKDFQHEGLGTTYYMKDPNKQDMDVIRDAFPDKGYRPYLPYMQALDYDSLGLSVTTLHGDWHQQNMSFNDPLFLFDLDTICRGAGVEEIARTLTHWAIVPEKIKGGYTNLTAGYGLSEQEKRLVPPLAIAQLYKKYAEYNGHDDPRSMEETKRKISVFKKNFSLS